jgi:hypothetical protein
MERPDPRRRVRREIVAAIIGAEAGIAVGLFVVGGTPLGPLGLAALGAGTGAGFVHVRQQLIRRWLRSQLRAAR